MPLEQFWLPEGRVVGSTPDDQSTISTAYTRDVWEGVVAPMLETYQREQPAHKPRIGEFRTAYFNDYFADWASFMAGFQNGVTLWRGHYDELLTRAAGPDSPYLFFFRSINHNLYGLPLDWPLASRWNAAWSEMKSAWLSSWRPFGGFVADSFRFGGVKVAPPIWLLAIRDTESNVLARQQADFARAYLRLQAEGSGQDVYQVASEIFASKGRPEKPPASEYASLLDSVDKPPEKFATGFKGDDLGAWSVVQGPSRLLLFLTVYRAGDYVQQRWSEGVLRPLAALPPQEQISALYGEQGKLGAFVNDWLKPFITEKERLPVKVAGVAMPLSPAYQSMVASERRFLPVLDNATSFPAGTFGVSRPSDLGALNEGDAGTVLEIDCRERVFRASSVGESLSESKAQVSYKTWIAIGKELIVLNSAEDEIAVIGNKSLHLCSEKNDINLYAQLGSIVCDAMQMISLKAGPSSIVLGPSGITIDGPIVSVNCGGSPKSAPMPPGMQMPETDIEGDQSIDGKVTDPGQQDQAKALHDAAKAGQPFCAECEAARKAVEQMNR